MYGSGTCLDLSTRICFSVSSAALLYSASASFKSAGLISRSCSNFPARYFCRSSRLSGGVASIWRKSSRSPSGKAASRFSRSFSFNGFAFLPSAPCSSLIWLPSFSFSAFAFCPSSMSPMGFVIGVT